LEEVLGVDLIYFNEHYPSFVMVQYKAMDGENDEEHFRLPNKQLDIEVARIPHTAPAYGREQHRRDSREPTHDV